MSPGQRSGPHSAARAASNVKQSTTTADTTSVTPEPVGAQLRRRRASSWRLPPLDDHGRRDPLDPHGREKAIAAWRSTWSTLRAAGLLTDDVRAFIEAEVRKIRDAS